MVPRQQESSSGCPLLGQRLLRQRTNQHPLHPLPLSASTALQIVPLPKEITSWLTSLLRCLPVKQQLVEKHTRTKLGRGTGTQDDANKSDSETTLSLMDYRDNTESRSWAPSPWLSVMDGFLDEMMIPWLKKQSQIPSTLWLRPSESTDAKTPKKTSTITLHDFYANN